MKNAHRIPVRVFLCCEDFRGLRAACCRCWDRSLLRLNEISQRVALENSGSRLPYSTNFLRAGNAGDGHRGDAFFATHESETLICRGFDPNAVRRDP